MRSAYQVLGVPGNADETEIRAAFAKAREFYSPQRLASESGAVDKFNEIQTAFKVLVDAESRAAHDRKLAAAAKPSPARQPVAVVPAEEASPYARIVKAAVWLLIAVFAAGFYVSYRNAEARRQQAAAELAAHQQAEKEAEERRKDAEKAEAERAQAKAAAEAAERRLAVEARYTAAQAAAERARSDAAAVEMRRVAAAEAQRREATAQAEQRRAEYEAQRRIAQDKQRIRELCYQNYRRPDC